MKLKIVEVNISGTAAELSLHNGQVMITLAATLKSNKSQKLLQLQHKLTLASELSVLTS